jgi:uncharacterized membrane protein
MRSPKLIVLLGLVILVIGVGATQLSTREDSKKLSYTGISLVSPGNATLILDLGRITRGTRVEITWLSDPALQVMMIRADTKEPVAYDTPLEWDQIRLYGNFPVGVMIDNGGYHLKKNPLYYNHIPETSEYKLILSVPTYTPSTFFPTTADLPSRVSVQNFNVQIFPTASYPYEAEGQGLVIVGFIIIIMGLILGRRKKYVK